MQLSSIVNGLEFTKVQGSLETDISSVAFDSREVTEGGIFVAISGFETDGHLYISKAIERGAAAVIIEKDTDVDASITVLQVKDSRDALALLSSAFYGDPTKDMNLIGVTGTNGKTSITYFVQSILEHAGRSVGFIGTTGTYINGKLTQNKNTTPESLYLQQQFASMRDAGMDNCIMEVSSHAISLKRIAHSHFNYGIFSNLTPDHLELHLTMEAYFEAKAQLFEMTVNGNIVNADDPYGRRLIEQLKNRSTPLLTYGMENNSDVYADNLKYLEDKTTYIVHTPAGSIPIEVHIPGSIYVYNTLAAIAFGVSNGISLEHIQAGISSVTGIKGRLETVYQDEQIKVIVDFAHTEDGLERVLKTVRPYTNDRIILVFGVYASEDVHGENKRSAMGRIAGTLADLAVVTSDNPKNQDPHRIIREITEAIQQVEGNYRDFLDRKEAIHFALDHAEQGDIVVITGKGHETSQIIGKIEIPFNEKEIVNEYMSLKHQALQ